ncbi:GntR family transcriptional regulator [Paradesulfitobacterium ferrireducens]|uniref:GntR family transcriptional regulator n=1 Tax=Paradesulfitobacterium ferrireducens TaxID=2816476 RepID=UPI001A8E6645|nr:GntR family transcriptional regulator [Paradesulfitobacterium ferrireducens]
MLPKIGSDVSLSEKAYLVIKNAILNNKLKPKEILSEEALAAELGISRTPLRSALKKLSFEGLVVINPGRNAMVADLSFEDAKKVFTVRIALEPLAAKAAATSIKPEELMDLQEILESQEEAIKMNDYELFLQKDYEFHTAVGKYSDNDLLGNFMQTINVHVHRFLILSGTLKINAQEALREHKEVLAAIKNGDGDTAEKMMKQHVKNVSGRL